MHPAPFWSRVYSEGEKMTTELKKYVKEVGRKELVRIMEHAGFKASLMRAERLTGDGLHGLPPGEKIEVFPIASLPGCPDGWVREAGTYVVPVDADWGLWFDWTMNDALNHAIIPSVKGMNPITGRKIEGFDLEEYADKCPIHGCALTHGNLCSECGYEWPPQNYVCAPNKLWFDGFRQPDGSVRQFFFTDEVERDIASAAIGKENTVPAFGFACYKPKSPRTPPNNSMMRGVVLDGGIDMDMNNIWTTFEDSQPAIFTTSSMHEGPRYQINTGAYGSSLSKKPTFPMSSYTKGKKSSQLAKSTMLRSKSIKEKSVSKLKKTKAVSVGGGARINQSLQKDSLGLDGWLEKPSAVIRLYFCFEKQFRQIVKDGGVRELKRNPEGYLDGLKVG